MQEIQIKTHRRSEMLDVTHHLREAVQEAGITEGEVIAFVPHTTAGITINENADPDVVHDMLEQLDRMVPWSQPFYQHAEGNSAAHVKTTMTGSSETIFVSSGRLVLGTWQSAWFCEFDGPRTRKLLIRVRGE